ncbi:GGDEF domain-containing protein [uncultured Ruminococcus sp.]|uniref:substrate-binding and GGDEF domain-containing protein n=1 Tax=uncultured Ruminococcus sp. TaxID=165186 RepID=UPI0025DBCF59|nr:GGDEF domain-containing protein [uncultured Ruminococcus sp.]
MINSRKTIAVFMNHVSTTYRLPLCEKINLTAAELGYNVMFFNFLGIISGRHKEYGEYEYKLIDVIPYDQFAGIIFDEESFSFPDMVERLVAAIKKKADCPVISISSMMEDFYNILIDDSKGIELIVRHLYEHHGCRKIGYMSGPFSHPDAIRRYDAFKKVMTDLGLPEDGCGVFEGDFWLNRGRGAAEYFLTGTKERPEAIVCANDYMAMALCKAFDDRGVNIPDDIIVTGFDGTEEGQEHIPKLTTVNCGRETIAETAVKLIDGINKGEKPPKLTLISPSVTLGNTCGCTTIDYKKELRRINELTAQSRSVRYYLGDVIGATLKMNIVESIADLEQAFADYAVNFGGYRSFLLMSYIDKDGKSALEKGMSKPADRVYPVIQVDRWGDHDGERKIISTKEFLPTENKDEPRFVYVTGMHCGDRCFGYCAVTMTGHRVFNEFFTVWIATLSVALESLLRRNNILDLVDNLEDISERDGLTGMYNRRGFEMHSEFAAGELEKDTVACAMVIDMDGLKRINDRYGHAEGDFAIRALADMISECCTDDIIAGRTGGDEFYVFAPGYNESKADIFYNHLTRKIDDFNSTAEKPYLLSASFGAFVHEKGKCDLEEMMKRADERMYAVKQTRKHRRSTDN